MRLTFISSDSYFTWYTEWLQKGKDWDVSIFLPSFDLTFLRRGHSYSDSFLQTLTVQSPIKVSLFPDGQYPFYSGCAIWPLSVIKPLSWMKPWFLLYHRCFSPLKSHPHATNYFSLYSPQFERHYPQANEAQKQVNNSLQMIQTAKPWT